MDKKTWGPVAVIIVVAAIGFFAGRKVVENKNLKEQAQAPEEKTEQVSQLPTLEKPPVSGSQNLEKPAALPRARSSSGAVAAAPARNATLPGFSATYTGGKLKVTVGDLMALPPEKRRVYEELDDLKSQLLTLWAKYQADDADVAKAASQLQTIKEQLVSILPAVVTSDAAARAKAAADLQSAGQAVSSISQKLQSIQAAHARDFVLLKELQAQINRLAALAGAGG